MENSPFIVRPMNKQLFQISPEQSHPSLSLRRVLWVKFLRWIDKSPSTSLLMAFVKCLTLALCLCAVAAPSFLLGLLTASAQWHNFRLPIMVAIVVLVPNAKRFWSFARRLSVKRKQSRGNQHTYHGIPLDNVASYLFTKQAFTTAAMSDLALSQRKWAKIAEELEHNGVLVRGESNSRILADIDRETLVRQLRDNFPLAYDVHTKTWIEKHGSYERFLHEKERSEKKDVQRVEKLERKEGNIRERIAKLREEQNSFQSVMSLMQ